MNINNFVLLAAGRGSRLSELTSLTPKPLLPVCGVSALQRIIDKLILINRRDIVVVTGYQHDKLHSFLSAKYGGEVNIVYNELYDQDTNILSVDMGVDALKRPDQGYTIIETDIILEPAGWDKFFSLHERHSSAWATCGLYSRQLTGGAIKVDENSSVTKLVYAPEYQTAYKGWLKMLGILKVGRSEVLVDRALRKKAITKSLNQYYLMPWLENVGLLPCGVIDLSGFLVRSYNDLYSYNQTNELFSMLKNKG